MRYVLGMLIVMLFSFNCYGAIVDNGDRTVTDTTQNKDFTIGGVGKSYDEMTDDMPAGWDMATAQEVIDMVNEVFVSTTGGGAAVGVMVHGNELSGLVQMFGTTYEYATSKHTIGIVDFGSDTYIQPVFLVDRNTVIDTVLNDWQMGVRESSPYIGTFLVRDSVTTEPPPAPVAEPTEYSGLACVTNNWATATHDYNEPEIWGIIDSLNVREVRMPGSANRFHWRDGTYDPKNETDDMDRYRNINLGDLMQKCLDNNLAIIYTLSVWDSVSEWLAIVEFVETNNYPVVAYEIGNEAYSGTLDIPVEDYYAKAQEFADAYTTLGYTIPLGISLAPPCVTGKNSANNRNWNDALALEDLSLFTGGAYHVYVNLAKDIESVVAEYNNCGTYFVDKFPGLEPWVTELNVKKPKLIEGYKDTQEHADDVVEMYSGLLFNGVPKGCYHSLDGGAYGLVEDTPLFDELSVVFKLFGR